VENTLDKQGSKGGQSEQPGFFGGLAHRLQEGVRATLVALGQSHAQRLAALVESSDDAILSVDLDGTIATWNHGAEVLFGYASEEIIGKAVSILIPGDRQEPDILERVGRGEHVQHYETVRVRKDGRRVPVSLSISPIMDSGGTIIGASKIVRDMTERKRADEVLAKRVDEQAALYQFTDRLFRAGSVQDIYQSGLDAIVRALSCERASILLFDDAGVMKFVAWRGLSDHYRRAVEGHSPWTRQTKNPEPISFGDIEGAELESSLKDTVKAEGIAALAFIPLTARGELVGKFMTYYEAPHVFTDAEINLAVTIGRQLGFGLERVHLEEERRKAEEAKALLVSESTHRIKNTLATVQAIARQTLPRIQEGDLQTFLARLHALGEAHEVLTSDNWDSASLGEVVGRALKPFQASQDKRFVAKGPQVLLPASTSLALTMCLHELATNAAKYGALSNGTGRVRVTWKLVSNGERSKVRLSWRETGGPPVTAPERKGFGSLLIEQSFNGEGEGRVDFRPDGVRCSLELSL
jgi:PAS domain S-box-containing protein